MCKTYWISNYRIFILSPQLFHRRDTFICDWIFCLEIFTDQIKKYKVYIFGKWIKLALVFLFLSIIQKLIQSFFYKYRGCDKKKNVKKEKLIKNEFVIFKISTVEERKSFKPNNISCFKFTVQITELKLCIISNKLTLSLNAQASLFHNLNYGFPRDMINFILYHFGRLFIKHILNLSNLELIISNFFYGGGI